MPEQTAQQPQEIKSNKSKKLGKLISLFILNPETTMEFSVLVIS